ncbi:MAG: hypothetical protein PUD31_07035 [Solobacterium sp.]|nr:hypothetical protein [Solobacterium sp.]
MKVKALDNFFDLKIKKQIKIDEEYEVEESRANELIEKNLVQLVIEDEEKDVEEKSSELEKV